MRAAIRTAKHLARRTLVGAGLMAPIPERYQAIGPVRTIGYAGDDPVGTRGGNERRITGYLEERPRLSWRENLVYTPIGQAWHKGRIDEFASFSPVRSPYLQLPYLSRIEEVAEGTVVQSEHTYTYGDWMSEHVRTLAAAPEIRSPLYLPGHLAGRGYVRGDLARLGIEAVFVDRPIRIKRALVLHKVSYYHSWTPEDAEAYRRAIGLTPAEPRPGSILYLSRAGVASEGVGGARRFPSREIAETVTRLGGRAVDTGRMGFDDFRALEGECETVVADHGAALFNLLNWNTRAVVELVTDDWWDDCFLSLGWAVGLERHTILRVSGLEGAVLDQKLTAAIRGEDVSQAGSGA